LMTLKDHNAHLTQYSFFSRGHCVELNGVDPHYQVSRAQQQHYLLQQQYEQCFAILTRHILGK